MIGYCVSILLTNYNNMSKISTDTDKKFPVLDIKNPYFKKVWFSRSIKNGVLSFKEIHIPISENTPSYITSLSKINTPNDVVIIDDDSDSDSDNTEKQIFSDIIENGLSNNIPVSEFIQKGDVVKKIRNVCCRIPKLWWYRNKTIFYVVKFEIVINDNIYYVSKVCHMSRIFRDKNNLINSLKYICKKISSKGMSITDVDVMFICEYDKQLYQDFLTVTKGHKYPLFNLDDNKSEYFYYDIFFKRSIIKFIDKYEPSNIYFNNEC